MRIKLTKAVVEALEPADKVLLIHDAELPGFGLRITPAGAKAWIVERKVSGKTVRLTVGRVGIMPLPDARAAGLRMLASLADGDRPQAKAAVVTLFRAFEDYVRERTSVTPGLKPRTVRDYRILFQHLADWHATPVAEITRPMVRDRHAALTAKPSPATANRVMRVLSAVMNYAVDNDDYQGALASSPVTVLKQRRLWNRERRRTSHLDAHTLPAWWALVDDVDAEKWPDRWDVVQDYWRFLLFTGMRSAEAARLMVSGVDLARGLIGVGDMKNRDDFATPVGPWLLDLLRRRVAYACEIGSQWVFPAPHRDAGHTASAHDIRYILNAKHGLEWTPHDLRRTFATVLDSLEVSRYVVKRLLGHRLGADVTAGYIVTDIDRLRPIMTRLESRMLELCQYDQAAVFPEVIQATTSDLR